ncbi:MAG: hypothetical protein IJH04_02060 [Eggerthellaceae bacterium]|nr:hypothetical protein [Eggerthellaceae bacterium]
MSIDALKRADEEAKTEINAIFAQPDIEYEDFASHLRAFAFKKFLLDPADCEGIESLDELTELSLARVAKVSAKAIADIDAGQDCNGATSVTVKKTLLIVRVQKDLSIQFSIDALMKLETLDDLVHVAWDEFNSSDRTADVQSSADRKALAIEVANIVDALDNRSRKEQVAAKRVVSTGGPISVR